MSTTAFDLGRRLRAAHEQRPVPNIAHAPALPPSAPIAVQARTTDTGHQVLAASTTTAATATGPEALEALQHVGVTLSTDTFPTLLVADRESLATLLTLAERCAWHPTLSPVAAIAAWWAARAEHPGTGATIVIIEALRRRWTLGVPESDERDLSTWATWLKTPGTDTDLLHNLCTAVTTNATPFPGLQSMHSQDQASWEWLRQHPTLWANPDSRAAAALALTTRCDATDLYNSFQLDDPLAATRATHSGEVVTGTITSTEPLQLTADHTLSRLRADTDVEGWFGHPWETHQRSISARIESTQVTTAGELVLTLTPASRRSPYETGQRLTLRPRRVDPFQQMGARRQRRQRHAAPTNWLATRDCPAPLRRDVPLDIAIAAATDD